MPHKRAKRSAREQQKRVAGSDLAPVSHSISKEAVPKSVSRVLNAAKVQEEWREKNVKRKLEEDRSSRSDDRGKKRRRTSDVGGNNQDAGSMKIQPGETLAHFNRRVENSLRGTVRVAMQTSSAHARKTKDTEVTNAKPGTSTTRKGGPALKQLEEEEVPPKQAARQGPTEFISLTTSTPRRLNDIVQAPPELKKFPRDVKSQRSSVPVDQDSSTGNRSLREGVLSMAQKAMLEEERERAVRLYREMKRQNTSS